MVEMTGFLKVFILLPEDSFNRATLPAISVGSMLRTQTTLSFPLTMGSEESREVDVRYQQGDVMTHKLPQSRTYGISHG